MEVNGQDFLRNVNIEQDKLRLKKEQEKLEKEKTTSVKKTPDYFESDEDAAYVDINFDKPPVQETQKATSQKQANNLDDDLDENLLRDIMLEPKDTKNDKKRYMILGLVAVIVFIVVIVVARIVSNKSQEKEIIQEEVKQQKPAQEIKQDRMLDKINSEEDYKSIIKENHKIIHNDTTDTKDTAVKKDIILPEPIKEASPVKIEPQKRKKEIETKKDLFGIEKTKLKDTTKKQTVAKKTTKPKKHIAKKPIRKTVIPAPKEIKLDKKPSKLSNGAYYVQIGAFSKRPNPKYLNNITKHGYDYTIKQVVVKGKTFNKLLIGPYPSRSVASRYLGKIRTVTKNKRAFILKLKK